MMPLCTTANLPPSLVCGCELTSLGAPCVAQRVCPMPSVPATALPPSIRLLEHAEPALRLRHAQAITPNRPPRRRNRHPRYSSFEPAEESAPPVRFQYSRQYHTYQKSPSLSAAADLRQIRKAGDTAPAFQLKPNYCR